MPTIQTQALLGIAGTDRVCTALHLANIASRIIVMDKGQKVLDGPKAEVAAQLRQMSAARAAE